MPLTLINAWILPSYAFWWASTLSAISIAQGASRPTAHEASLPISGRDLAVAKLASSLAFSMLPLLLTALIVALHSPAQFEIVRLLQGIVLVALANVLPRLVRPREFSVAVSDTMLSSVVLFICAALAIFYIPEWIAFALFASALFVAATIWWRTIPESFQAASPIASSSTLRENSTSLMSAGRLLPAWWVVVPGLFTWQRLFVCSLAFFTGILRQWPIAIVVILSLEDLWLTSNRLLPLPVSVRTRLWMILGPGLVLNFALIVLGAQIHLPLFDAEFELRRDAPGHDYGESATFYTPTKVGLEYWEKVEGEVAPSIVAPSGETAAPYTVKLYGRMYYNPFSSRETSSQQFADWQFKRLTTAVYGVPFTPDELQTSGFYPRRISAGLRMMTLNLTAAFTLAFLYLVAAWVPKMRAFWGSGGALVWMQFAVATPMILFLLYPMFTLDAPGAAASLIQRQLMDLSPKLPQNYFALLAVCLIPVSLAYSLLEWQFARSEFVPLKKNRV